MNHHIAYTLIEIMVVSNLLTFLWGVWVAWIIQRRTDARVQRMIEAAIFRTPEDRHE
jgi:ABC-type sulfate transport system permease component